MRNLWAFLLLCAPGQALAQPALPTTSAGYTARIYSADATLLGPGGLAIDANRVVVVDPRGSGPSGTVGAGRVRAADRPAPVQPLPQAMAAQRSEGGLRIGQSVFHAKFGEGVVMTLEGSGADARAQVNFGRHGAKWLALAIAKLTPVD